jgi:hypothetical protein
MVNMLRMSIWEYIFEAGNYFFRVDQSDWKEFYDDLSYEETEDDGLNGIMLRFEKQSGAYSKEVQGHFSRFILLLSQWVGSLFQKTNKKEEVVEAAPHSTSCNRTQDIQGHINQIVRKRLLQKLNEDSEYWLESAYYRRKSASRRMHTKNTYKNQPEHKLNGLLSGSLRSVLDFMHTVFYKS